MSEHDFLSASTPAADALVLESFDGQEELSLPFLYSLQFLSKDRKLDFKKMMGKAVTITLVLPDKSKRYICGIVSHDASKSEVVVRAGTRLKDLNAALAARGLALPIVGSIAEQAIAGALSTATHGSSLVHGNLASLVTAVQLVDGKGDLLDIPSGDPRLPGARVHLGALGVLTSITLRVVPAFRLAEEIEQIPISEATRNLEAIAHSAEYVKVWWIPRTQETQVYRYHRTDEPESTWPHPETLRFIDNKIGQDRLFPLFAAIQTQFPRTIPTINRWLAKTLLRPRVALQVNLDFFPVLRL